MSRYTGKRNRIARRFGVNIFGRARNPLLHKANPPGQHGARRRKKSDFGLQLEEKQKLKAIYGMISESQLIKYYQEAERLTTNTAQNLACMLECRLDNVVYRLKFATTIFGAHQLVSHGHIMVNGKKVDRRSFHVKPGMVVSIAPKAQKFSFIKEAQENPRHTIPDYFSVDKDKFAGHIIEYPTAEQMPWPIEINLAEICDFLAHSH